MPDFSRWGANGGDPSLNAIARTDRYLDALASEHPAYATDPADAELANLMAGWRDDVRRPPARVASQRDAEMVLARALANRRRNRMSVAVMGSVAAALLCLGGFGAVVYGSGPGDALYGLRTAVFGEQQVTRDDQVALAAQTEMQQVQQLIDQGNWTAAQDKLSTITSTVQTVQDPQRQQQLQDQLNQLSVKVENRDANATVPPASAAPAAPGVPNVPLPGLPGGAPLPIPNLPLPGPGAPLPIPNLPLPGPGAPLPIPNLPLPIPNLPIPLPKPGDDLPIPVPKPGDLPAIPIPKPLPPLPDNSSPLPLPIPKPLPNQGDDSPIQQQKPGRDQQSPDQGNQDQPPQKPVEQPKQLAPEPAPAQVPPPALAPQQDQPPVVITTTVWPIPPDKPNKRGD
jgi:Anti-sigma-D factor RsdA to sigma factor binding region